MSTLDADADDPLAHHDNRMMAVENRVDLVLRDLVMSEQLITVAVARAA